MINIFKEIWFLVGYQFVEGYLIVGNFYGVFWLYSCYVFVLKGCCGDDVEYCDVYVEMGCGCFLSRVW